ncbi:MAG: Calx-beta domain-containing protein [Dehalococcoidia bacterium]
MNNTLRSAQPRRALILSLALLAMVALAVVSTGDRSAYAAACTYSLSSTSYSVNEGQAAQITVTESGSCTVPGDQFSRTAFVQWTGAGTATPNVDFQNSSFGANFATGAPQTRVIAINTFADNVNEGNETFTIELVPPTGTNINGNGSAVVTIVDDDGDSTYSYQAGSASVSESAGAVTVTVLRGGATAGTASVQCTVTGGTASGSGVDFTISDSTANFADGANTATCGLTIIQDGITETGGETIILGFTNPVDLPGGATAPTTTTITITDDDGPGTVQFTSATYSVSESGGVASFGVSRTGGSTGSASVTCAATTGPGTATSGADYTPQGGQLLTWVSGNSSTQFCNVGILTDSLVEGPEQFGLTLSGASGASLGAQNTATVTIDDDDGTGQIVFSSTSYAGLENGGAITITVNRTGGTGGGSVTYTTSNGPAPSATAGVDYTATTGQLTWGTNDLTSKTFTVTPINDNLVEGGENVTLTLSAPTGGLTIGTPSTSTLIITDDESPFPSITNISPGSGTTLGGTPVTISGVNFTGATSVTFGGLICGSIVVVNDTTITCVTPAHTAGAVDVIVTTPSGPSSTSGSQDDFIYTGGPTITSLNPATGPASGNTIITLTGTNFTSSGTVVKFDGIIAVFTYIDAQTLVVVSPAHSAGTVDVRVTTPGGTTPNTTADDYTYTGASVPVVSSLSPSSGPTGTTVTISGSGFTGATLVSFGGVAATYTVNSDAQITASVPASTPGGTVDVRVTTPSGTSANTTNDNFNNTSTSGATLTYTLYFRFTLIVWTGQNNVSALAALTGLESPDNPNTNNVVALVGAIWRFDATTQTFKGYFPGSDNIPGANDFTTLSSGVGYFVALRNQGTVSWTVPAP